jgi:hypothetical protein
MATEAEVRRLTAAVHNVADERDRYREALERIAAADVPYPRIIARYALNPERNEASP